jgi:hypothetical protein
MALDLDRGNRLELPWLGGEMVELGRALGAPTHRRSAAIHHSRFAARHHIGKLPQRGPVDSADAGAARGDPGQLA